MKCRSCGAEVPADHAVCEFCGSAPLVEVIPSDHSGGGASNEALFAKIKQSAEFAQRDTPQRQAALPKYSAIAKVVPFVFLSVFIGIAGFMTVMVFGTAAVVGSPIPALMSVCPLSFVGIGIFAMVMLAKKGKEYQAAPIVARAAIITGRRTAVSGGSGDSSASTSYFLTAEFEDGTRQEYQPMTADLFARTAERDAGVLFTRSKIALDFDRIA